MRFPSLGRAPSSKNCDLKAAIEAVSKATTNGEEDLDDVEIEVIDIVKREPIVDVATLRLVRPLGSGGQGGVWLAVDGSGASAAVKEVRKGRVASLPSKSSARVFMEREALLELGAHPFITRLHGTFQDADSLYFAMTLAAGGDLFSLLDVNPGGLHERDTRFYAAGVSLALRHIHSHGYLYRDVKLENVLIGCDGYAMLCDFGFAKKLSTARTYTKCGTDEYSPPEVVNGRGRSTAADWWGLGILLHELLIGHPPFGGASGQEVFDQISQYSLGGKEAAHALRESVSRAASTLSDEATRFLANLLHVRESDRIGCGPAGFVDIQNDAWFASVDWAAMLRKQVDAPWLPPVGAEGGTYITADDFSCDSVMALKEFDHAKWDPIFAPFGPTLPPPRREGGA